MLSEGFDVELETVAARYAAGELGYHDVPYNELSNMVWGMRVARKFHCGGRSLREWSALVDFIARAHVHRELSVELHGSERDMAVGYDGPHGMLAPPDVLPLL